MSYALLGSILRWNYSEQWKSARQISSSKSSLDWKQFLERCKRDNPGVAKAYFSIPQDSESDFQSGARQAWVNSCVLARGQRKAQVGPSRQDMDMSLVEVNFSSWPTTYKLVAAAIVVAGVVVYYKNNQ